MKAFEAAMVADKEDPWRSRSEIAEYYWRAALEYVVGEHGPLDERVHNCDCARGRIRKELEN